MTALRTRVQTALGHDPLQIFIFAARISAKARSDLIEFSDLISGGSFLTPAPIPDAEQVVASQDEIFNGLDLRKRRTTPIMPKWVRARLRDNDFGMSLTP